ncbi:hypothetical protein [Caballeronia sp. KNU42]
MAEGSGGNVGIVRIPVDTDAWDSFITSFHNWQGELEKQNGAWAGTNRGVKELGNAFDHVEETFSDLVHKATDSKFSNPTSGVFTRVKKDAAETERSWRGISREIEKANRGLTGIVRNGGMGLLGLFAAGGGLAASLYGATAGAASSVAGDYKISRQLGLHLGKEKEFGIAGEPYGLGRDALEEAANAKADPTKQLPFLNAGVSAQDLATLDAAELAWKKAQGEAKLYSAWEKTSPQFAVAQAQAFFPDENPDQLRLLADAFDKGDLDKAHDQYERDWPKVGYTEQEGEAATKFKQDQAQKWADIERAWNRDILMLAPHLDAWSTAATDLAVSLLDNTAKTVKELADAGDNPTPPGTAIPHAAPGDYPGRIREGAQVVGQWLQAHGLRNPFDDAGADTVAGQPGFVSDPDKAKHMAALENIWSLPRGLLQADENIESSGGSNLINPNNPNVLGAFQFDKPTADAYGVDRTSEYSSEVGAARYLADLHKKYGDWGKAAAAFDGFAGLDKDIQKYGDKWRDHISEFQKSGETSRYLDKLEKQGIDLSGGHNPFNDPKALKAAKEVDAQNDPRILPMDSIDAKALNAQQKTMVQDDQQAITEGLTDRLKRGFGMIGDFLSEGGGARFATPVAPARTLNSTQQPQANVSLSVTAPPGHDVQITGAQLAQ